MFESLSNRLNDTFRKLRGKGLLSEADVNAAMREVRIALLEADVALPVVKDFINSLKEKAVGEEIIRSVSPGQMVIKLVQDHLTELLGSEQQELNLAAEPPVVILMVGLQGSGKTTSTGKLARWVTNKHHKRCLMASLDVYRPAAQEQLRVLGEQTEIATLPVIEGQQPVDIAKRALQSARSEGYDVLFLDTAGRLHIDDTLMDELQAVRDLAGPLETLLVADALTGQDAVNIAREFNEKIGVTGIILTRIDGDGRGGAALSMRHVTGSPIKFLGTGEKIDAFEAFHPDRIASRILDMGDVVSMVEKAAETIDQDEAEKAARKALKGDFDLSDLESQLHNMKKMGGFGGLMGMLPGVGKMKQQMGDMNVDDKMIDHQIALIRSMTPDERRFPKKINASRRKRIAAGAGMTVQDVNRLLKQFQQMQGMMKKLKKMGKKGMMRGGLEGLLGGGR